MTRDGGKPRFATAHDLRRSFGDRWAQRVMPAILKELMRHRSIDTTMEFYVGRSAEQTADVLWAAVTGVGDKQGDKSPSPKNIPAKNS